MKQLKLLGTLVLLFLSLSLNLSASPPDSAYILGYSTIESKGHSGLYLAWSIDRKNWHSIGAEHRFLFCDYGSWGREKRMLSPSLFLDKSSIWHCIWSVNEYDNVFAHATSTDLVYWQPQTYPEIMPKRNNCLRPEIGNTDKKGEYQITWLSTEDDENQVYRVTTKDFKSYTPAEKIPTTLLVDTREEIEILNSRERGTVHKVAWSVVDNLIKAAQLANYSEHLYQQSSKDDTIRFADLKPVNMTIKANVNDTKKISNLLIGAFFEDINYAADGGLYAELIQNRDFEYTMMDRRNSDKSWNHQKAWNAKNIDFTIDTLSPIHPNNKHFATLKISEIGGIFSNEGFDGIYIEGDKKYNLSFFARNHSKLGSKLIIRLADDSGNIFGQADISVKSSQWEKYEAVIKAINTANKLHLEIVPQNIGTLDLDMVSLFPQNTFKNRKNGLRTDLAQAIADIHPRFVRFPGGCVAHGDGLDNIYKWKNTIGKLEERTSDRNIWGYHQSMGLGYFEYFQFCEDIGAEPLPVLAAGVPCQNSSVGGPGQQGGIPMCDMDNYVQDILDLIEWANGDINTKWGKIRSQAGHPKPFDLKYVGIGNEDLINDIFEERFTKIYNAVKKKYPEITVVGTVGPFSEGTDYIEGWKIANKLNVPMVDEHYYQPPGWFINNNDYYDKYDRSKSKVYLGEYAAHLPGRPNNIETAISEAHYLTSLERNGDIVSMASYAPMLAKEGHTQWNPNLIYFNNAEVKPTVGYFVQKLFGQNSGDIYVNSKTIFSTKNENVRKQIASSIVKESKTGDYILKLVNILPTATNVEVEFDGSVYFQPTAEKSVLSGMPQDKKARPISEIIETGGSLKYTLLPYSFTVIRLQAKQFR
ncbi:MAG: alpha-L-arabinofuranosidase C-terminal domain-containing protein [Paludibacteraceae bacterium]